MLGVAANKCEEDPWSEQRRLGVPALLGEICPDRSAAGRQQEEQGSGEEGRPVHRENHGRFYVTQKDGSKGWRVTLQLDQGGLTQRHTRTETHKNQ